MQTNSTEFIPNIVIPSLKLTKKQFNSTENGWNITISGTKQDEATTFLFVCFILDNNPLCFPFHSVNAPLSNSFVLKFGGYLQWWDASNDDWNQEDPRNLGVLGQSSSITVDQNQHAIVFHGGGSNNLHLQFSSKGKISIYICILFF